MLDLKLALAWLWANKTKVFGYIQVTLGVLATASNVLSDTVVQFIVLLSGLMTAWIGHYNTTKQRELEEAVANAEARANVPIEQVDGPASPREYRNLAVLLGLFLAFTIVVPTQTHAALASESNAQWQLADGSKVYSGHATEAACWTAYAAKKAEIAKARTSGQLYLGCQKKNLLKFKANPPPVANRAPDITGTPVLTGKVGQPYSFQPSATDADGDELTFAITGQPGWGIFNSATGRLTGTPHAAGTYSNVAISVSDGTLHDTLQPFSIVVTQDAVGTATLSWTPPTQNTDGTPLTNLTGYKIVWGTVNALTNEILVNGAGVTSYVVTGLRTGSWSFAVRALTPETESANSNVASKLIQ